MKWGMKMNQDFFNIALTEAKIAYDLDEIPVGCAIFKDNELISKAHNCKESENNCIMHAEIVAISEACKKNGGWRLDDCVMYVTLEPCMMCMGAIIESRIKKVYYGTKNKNEQMYVFNNKKYNIELYNVKNVDSSNLLSDFFKNKRKK